MAFANWLRSFGFTRHTPATNRRTRPQRFRPRVEVLERRDVPSTLTVLNTNDSGPGSLRAEIAAANSGDTIVFDSSLQGQTITLTSGELVINKSLDIEGPATNPVTIDAEYASRDFNVLGGADVTIAHLAIVNGLSTEGGDILNAGDLALTGCGIGGGMAIQGGGVYNAAGASLSISNCNFFGNVAHSVDFGSDAIGGALYEAGGTVAVSNSTLNGYAEGDFASLGGVAYVAGGNFTVSNSTLEGLAGNIGNSFEGGGGLYQAGGVVVITNTQFMDCGAGSLAASTCQGGAIYQASGTLTLVNDQFLEDGAAQGEYGLAQGGAIYQAGGALEAVRCTFTDDVVETNVLGGLFFGGVAEGGAFYAAGGVSDIQNCSFEDNLALAPGDFPGANEGIGGAIYIAGGSVSISKNTSFADDFAATSNPDVFGPFTLS